MEAFFTFALDPLSMLKTIGLLFIFSNSVLIGCVHPRMSRSDFIIHYLKKMGLVWKNLPDVAPALGFDLVEFQSRGSMMSTLAEPQVMTPQ